MVESWLEPVDTVLVRSERDVTEERKCQKIHVGGMEMLTNSLSQDGGGNGLEGEESALLGGVLRVRISSCSMTLIEMRTGDRRKARLVA